MDNSGMNKIVCFGEVLWDMLPDGRQPGGAPMNVAIHLKRQGISPVLVSRVGWDDDGASLRDFLGSSGIGLQYLQTDDEFPTSRVLVHLDDRKNATYEICKPVAWDFISWNDGLESLTEEAGMIIFGTLASRNEKTRNTLLRFLENSEGFRLLDVNLRPPYDSPGLVEQFLGIADFVKLNHEELEIIAGWFGVSGTEEELAAWLSEKFICPGVCVTRGAGGAMLYSEGEYYDHPGYQVESVDTVGAGDAFLAGLVAGLTAGKTEAYALDYACATGAFVASKPGAVPDYTAGDIDAVKFKKA